MRSFSSAGSRPRRWLAFVLLPLLAATIASRTAGQTITVGTQRVATYKAVVNFSELAQRRTQPSSTLEGAPWKVPPRMLRPETSGTQPVQPSAASTAAPTLASAEILSPGAVASLSSLSPPVTASFAALGDNGTAIPPDTMGAVGPNHVMTTLNSQVMIQDRNGGIVSTVDIETFWQNMATFVFDPHVMYDPFGHRWIFTAAGDPQSPSSVVLVGVSATSDPTGTWYLYSVTADPAGLMWADYDTTGFNKNWIVVAVNLFPMKGNGSGGVQVYAFDKADLYAHGSGNFTLLADTSSMAFSVVPAQTYDNSLNTMYLLEDWDGSQGQLRISAITGTVGSEVLQTGTAFATTTNLWDTVPARKNPAPQLGSKHGIDLGDSRILSCQYRNGSLWASQNAFLPLRAATRSAAQWWQINPASGAVQQFGRIDDPAGGRFYAYPGLAVNASNDVLVGYSRFSSWQYAGGNYAFRFASDPPNTLHADTVLKIGEGPYYTTDNAKLNRWGDFSSTVVDPADDTTMWTIQEYAAAPVSNPTVNGSGQWATWWGRVPASLSTLKVAIVEPADAVSYPSNATVTVTATNLSSGTTFNKVEFFADTTKIGETNLAPYTIVWSDAPNGNYGLTAMATDTLGHQSTSSVVSVTIGDALSPVGTWETALAGSDKGTAYITLDDDFSLSGCGITLRSFGLFAVSGAWSYNRLHQVVGSYVETHDGTNLFSGSFIGKAVNGRKFGATVKSAGRASLRLNGAPAAGVPDLSGHWNAKVKIGTTNVTETWQLAPSTSSTNLFDLIGQGSGYSLTGSVIVTRRGALNMATTNGVARSLAGRVNSLMNSITLNGVAGNGKKIGIKATR